MMVKNYKITWESAREHEKLVYGITVVPHTNVKVVEKYKIL
jgi:hypothetical protein